MYLALLKLKFFTYKETHVMFPILLRPQILYPYRVKALLEGNETFNVATHQVPHLYYGQV